MCFTFHIGICTHAAQCICWCRPKILGIYIHIIWFPPPMYVVYTFLNAHFYMHTEMVVFLTVPPELIKFLSSHLETLRKQLLNQWKNTTQLFSCKTLEFDTIMINTTLFFLWISCIQTIYSRSKLSSQAQLQWKNWLPLSLRLQLKSAGWSDLQISCFLLSIPCLERDRVSKTDGDQWSISFPKTETMRLKIGSWKMFFVVTLLCFFFQVLC